MKNNPSCKTNISWNQRMASQNGGTTVVFLLSVIFLFIRGEEERRGDMRRAVEGTGAIPQRRPPLIALAVTRREHLNHTARPHNMRQIRHMHTHTFINNKLNYYYTNARPFVIMNITCTMWYIIVQRNSG